MQESSSAYTLAARRPIAAGDEVTSDYGTSTGEADFAMSWSCGSALCRGTITGNDWRGTITGNDWRRNDLRAGYQDHWIPVLMNASASDNVACAARTWVWAMMPNMTMILGEGEPAAGPWQVVPLAQVRAPHAAPG